MSMDEIRTRLAAQAKLWAELGAAAEAGCAALGTQLLALAADASRNIAERVASSLPRITL